MNKYKARSVSVPIDVMEQLDQVKAELEKQLGLKLSYPQLITYLIKHRSK